MEYASCCGCGQVVSPAGSEARVIVNDKVRAFVHANRTDCRDRAKKKHPGCTITGGTTVVPPFTVPGRRRDGTGKRWAGESAMPSLPSPTK